MSKPPKQTGGSEIRVIERAPLPALRMIGSTTTDAPTTLRWTLMLVWFMRTMAVVWIAKGLFAWTIVLGVNRVVADLLELPVVMQAMVSFFAVADLMAAVGLWLAAPWGGVLWLLCASIEVVSPALGVRGAVSGLLGVGFDIALVAVYFFLSWRTGHERI